MDNQDLMNDELVSRGKRMAVALSELPWWCHRGGGLAGGYRTLRYTVLIDFSSYRHGTGRRTHLGWFSVVGWLEPGELRRQGCFKLGRQWERAPRIGQRCELPKRSWCDVFKPSEWARCGAMVLVEVLCNWGSPGDLLILLFALSHSRCGVEPNQISNRIENEIRKVWFERVKKETVMI
jgi:hypothetical protein